MFVIIQDRDILNKYNLSNQQILYKGIRLYKKNSIYYIDLKKGLFFDDNSKSKQLSIRKYTICSDDVYYKIQIYVYESDKGINDFQLYKNTNLLISCKSNSNIICKDIYLSNYYLGIIDKRINTNFNVLVNGTIYYDHILSNGDIIDYLGIRIIYFDDFLYINSFNNRNNIEKYSNYTSIVKYTNQIMPNNHYIPSDIFELKIDDIKEYKQVKTNDNADIVKSIIPNTIMCLAMSMMAYLNYLNSNNDNPIFQYIIMPISMAITGILLPIVYMLVSYIKYKKAYKDSIDEYIDYLNSYCLKLTNDINKHTNSLNDRFFDLYSIKNMLFYATKKSDEFLTISIGKTRKSIPISIKQTGIDILDNMLFGIEKQCLNIENIPLFLDLKHNHIVTIVSKSVDKSYYFNKVLLELSYKHHFDDIYIGIYCKDIKLLNDVYNLPHLFIYNKRLLLVNEQELQELDSISIDKPLVLLSFDKYSYEFNNESIYQVYFSIDNNDILRNSDCIVEYKNNNGYLFSNSKICFNSVYESIKYDDYFKYLGRFKRIGDNSIDYSFKDIFSEDIIYANNSDKHSLLASFSYNDKGLINLDLHESKHGPHGLIGGSTGSGKSELIVSMLLSLCIRYSPEYLNIVLIDYKGGGLKESLSFNNNSLPHIIASVSNLEDNAIERLIYALHNECKRRQMLFNKLTNMCNASIMNLDDYIDNNIYNLDTIAHLLIVVDEFAELKKENPEQIKELISISRIGRSLGLHLILATQKPAGVIDEQIWSNSRFKIALKVFDDKDSQDLIQRKDAAYLYNPGSFLMLIDKAIVSGQNIYSKNDHYGNNPYIVSVLDNKLDIKKSFVEKQPKTESDANYYCKKIIDKCNNENYQINKLSIIPSSPIKRIIDDSNQIVFGQLDDYINNNYQILKYDINENILIYSSRKDEINSIINTLNDNHRQNVVIANNIFQGKYTSDSISYDAKEDIYYLFNKLLSNSIKDITILIEDINCLLSYEPKYLEYIIKLLKRGHFNNINLICLSRSSDISYKLISLFNNKIMININEMSDLNSFYGTKSVYKGNSYCYINEPLSFIPIQIDEYKPNKPIIENIVRSIPDKIVPNIVNDKYLLGFDVNNRVDVFADKDILAISYDLSLLMKYKNAYPNISIKQYDNSLRIENSNYLWLGPGIYNQRLFISNLTKDLDINQGLYISSNSQILIRSINNE